MAAGRAPARRWPRRAMVAIGVGLALAPVAFQMFTRAPAGGRMIDDFAPHMAVDEIEGFRADLATIGAARTEASALLAAQPDAAERFPNVGAFSDAWPAIDADMSSMLATMEDNVDNYLGVAALPPFALFPWFFVLPGALIAGVAGWSLRTDRGTPSRGPRLALVVVAAGLIAAPVVFQMFTRAPGGAEMIEEFRPFMRSEKVADIQGFFLTIGNAEGELRRAVLPELTTADGATPAITDLNEQWPAIAGGMAPMIGTMADNVTAFAGISALPPFWAFPWFFVLPGVLVLGLVGLAGGSPRPVPAVAGSTSAEPSLEGA